MKLFIIPVIALTTLVACGDPKPLSSDRADFDEAELDNDVAFLLDPTPVEDIPNGSATYEGQFTSDATINQDTGYLLVGDVELTADFGASRAVDLEGEIDNINLIDRFDSDRQNSQELRGSLDIDGVTRLGEVNGNATGELTAVLNNDGFLRTSDVDLDLDGRVVGNDGQTIFGTIDGEGRGGFDLELIGRSEFTAVAD